VVGPYDEGSSLSLNCIVIGGTRSFNTFYK
jgi:hypothetical protein